MAVGIADDQLKLQMYGKQTERQVLYPVQQ